MKAILIPERIDMIIGFRSASERWSDDVYAHSPPLQHHVRFPLGTIAAGGSFLLDVTGNKPRLLNNINSCILWTLLCKQWLGMFSNEEPVYLTPIPGTALAILN